MENSKKTRLFNNILSVVLGVLCVVWLYPVILIFFNSFKAERAISTSRVFDLPTAESFVGFQNYIYGVTSMDFLKSFWYSLFISVSSVLLILLCCSMCAWYITRVKGKLSSGMYYLCAFSMVVPFQMVMFTLAKTADTLKLNSPYNICIIYLGFGAGLAVFMFTGFMKSMPLEIEEAAMIDGCNPMQTMRNVTIPLMRSSFVQCLFLSITRCFVVYDVNLSLTKGEPFNSSVMTAMHVYNQAFTYKNYGVGQAEALILFLVCAIVGVTQVMVGKKGEVDA